MSAASAATSATTSATTSPTTARATAFVEARLARATELGTGLADHLDDPEACTAALRAAFEELADPEYRDGQSFVAPGIGPTHGVRSPLQGRLRRGFLVASRGASTTSLLLLADRLLREPEGEARWCAIGLLEQTIGPDPERTWQLVRRVARAAGDWITVDVLAGVAAAGIAAEPYRWAELEQLVYSPSRWERRLVGSTIATFPHGDRREATGGSVVERALGLLAELIGDAEPDVQKALSWAYRSLADADRPATLAALEREAAEAARTDDGHRAWVVRDSLTKLEPADAARLRALLDGIRRRPGAGPTSRAASIAADFAGLGLGRALPQPPLT